MIPFYFTFSIFDALLALLSKSQQAQLIVHHIMDPALLLLYIRSRRALKHD